MAFDKAKPFKVETSYSYESYATQAEAEDAGKAYAAKSMTDTPVYKAISLVKAPIPTDIIVEQLS